MSRSITLGRINKEIQNMRKNKNPDFHAAPVSSNNLEWHFTIRGPTETPYEKGIYHGKILLPSDFPMSPPDISFFTESGRFEVNKKICLTITSFHKEEWSPSWTIETILQAISSMIPVPTPGAIGSIETPDVEVRQLALKSQTFKCPKCGEIRKIIRPRM
ncbi:ubiquitin-conjugating enzyme E2 [Blastocystis sp. ATCC 50177/Nand II]|uniref:Ubiquitin-conjugating enzyme E2 n=1 Tax=Blastocystis sp. subtype 1 (strain ATCC 50177 / NandII) TaxID=478820 RepID=A0A196S9W5_BLAHN|nr:ubiquitin-conjugating enzyme E2 [Blastocystis sp. ATCC 50177/Nand II]